MPITVGYSAQGVKEAMPQAVKIEKGFVPKPSAAKGL
jgi:hypothetical protein